MSDTFCVRCRSRRLEEELPKIVFSILGIEGRCVKGEEIPPTWDGNNCFLSREARDAFEVIAGDRLQLNLLCKVPVRIQGSGCIIRIRRSHLSQPGTSFTSS